MLNQPKLKDCFHWYSKGSEAVFLVSERDSIVLSESIYQLLMPLLDGHHTTNEIVDLLPEISATEIFYALMLMEKKGYIIENQKPLPDNFAIFCEHLNIEPKQAYSRLQATKVKVNSLGVNMPIGYFYDNLKSLQIKVLEEAELEPDLEIVLTDTYLRDSLNDFNQKALLRSTPWMLVKPVGTIVWIGPIFYPRKTGCWQCLAQRLRNNSPITEAITKNKDPLPLRPLGSLPSTLESTLGTVATEVFKWIVQGENRGLEGRLVVHDHLTLTTQNHILVKRPQCPSCGKIFKQVNRKPLPIILGHRQKKFTADGGHRNCSPEETLRKYQHHISPITGVVRELRKVEQLDNSLSHTYRAKHHFVTMFDNLQSLRQNLAGRSAGKGRMEQQAKVSGLCEAIERYSGVFSGDENRQTASYQQMGDKAIHPNTCMNFSQAQYENRLQWNASVSSWFQRVPDPFDEEREIEWTPVWSLTHQTFKYLPTAYCYYGYPKPQNLDCWADSNGCAAGNTLEEAILQGFMELVERDCVALWWYNRLPRPKVDLESFDDPYFQNLTAYYRSLDRQLWVLDLTNDLNIPVFAAITCRIESDVKDITLGFGSHFDAKLAVGRALTELNQILPNVLSAKADGRTQYPPFGDPLAIKWWTTATLENQPYLVPDPRVTSKVSSDYLQGWSDDLLEDVRRCQQIAEQNGMEMLVLDQTRPDIGLKVVKTIVPGMRHWWRRLGPGRLYDIPLKNNWLQTPLAEDQLNPWTMWM